MIKENVSMLIEFADSEKEEMEINASHAHCTLTYPLIRQNVLHAQLIKLSHH